MLFDVFDISAINGFMECNIAIFVIKVNIINLGIPNSTLSYSRHALIHTLHLTPHPLPHHCCPHP